MARWRRDQSFERAFDELLPRAIALAQRVVGDRAAAEDVAAEALARTYARWGKVRDLPYRDGWVLRVAANLAIDAVRRRRTTVAVVGSAADEDEGETATLRLALAGALRSLPRRQRDAVALRYLSDLTEAEIADSLGISLGTVKTHIHRGVAALRARLGDSLEEVTLDHA